MKTNEVVRKLTLAGWMVACSFWPVLGMAGDTATERSSSDPLGLITSVTAFPAMAPPGVVHEYQNQVFALGGLAAVRAAGVGHGDRALGRSYARLMREHVYCVPRRPR